MTRVEARMTEYAFTKCICQSFVSIGDGILLVRVKLITLPVNWKLQCSHELIFLNNGLRVCKVVKKPC